MATPTRRAISVPTGMRGRRRSAHENVAIYIDNFRTQRMGKLRLIRKSDGVFVGRAGFGV